MPSKEQRAARRADGLCENCGGRRAKPDCTRCVPCSRSSNATMADLRLERRERGLCTGCGKGPPRDGKWGCRSCVKKHRRWSLQSWRRKAKGGGGADS